MLTGRCVGVGGVTDGQGEPVADLDTRRRLDDCAEPGDLRRCRVARCCAHGPERRDAPANEAARAARRRACPRCRGDRAKPRQRGAACDRAMRWRAVTLTASSSVLSAVQAVAGARRRPAAQAASLVHVSGCRVGRASFVAGTHRYRRSIKGTAQRHRPARAAIAQRKRALSDDRSYRSHVSLITAHGAGGPLTPSAVTLGTLRRVPKRCR